MLTSKELELVGKEYEAKQHIRFTISLYNKFYKLSDICFKNIYQRQLNNYDFTIISNNCWGGVIYEHFNLPKLSPTVGVYFYAKEYLKFISNLRHYLSCDLQFICTSESKYAQAFAIKHQEKTPIGILDDVEIVFLHYSNTKSAYDKWNRRLDRINFDNLIVKFSEQNLCAEEDLYTFDALPFKKKIIFTRKVYPDLKNAICLPNYENEDSLLSDIHEYRHEMKRILKVINEN